MSERVTFAMVDHAMDHLAETLGVTYVPQSGSTITPKPGDITYTSHPQRPGRYHFGIYRYENDYNYMSDAATTFVERRIRPHSPEGYKSYNKRELHEVLRFMANVLFAHRGIIQRAKEMHEL